MLQMNPYSKLVIGVLMLNVFFTVGLWRCIDAPRLADVGDRYETLPFGVNLWGYLRGEFGVGEGSRQTASGFFSLAIPIALNDVRNLLNGDPQRHTDERLANHPISKLPQAPYLFNIFHINADMMPAVHSRLGAKFWKGHYNIGIWVWELDTFPEFWLDRFWYVDEVWTGTEFMVDAFRKVSPIPVQKVVFPVPPDFKPKQQHTRAHFGLQKRDYVFLFVFDFASFAARKNPWASLNAFHKAFPVPNDAVLIMKSINSELNAQDRDVWVDLQRNAEAIGSRVIFFSKHMTFDEVSSLFLLCDCFVSLHRSEGFGLGMIQALSLGKPVIATNYSGNTDFTTPASAYMVPYRLVPLEADYGPYKRGNVWAEPDINVAAQHMSYVFSHPGEAQVKATAAQEWVNREFSAAAAGQSMGARIDSLWKDRHAIMRYVSAKNRNRAEALPKPPSSMSSCRKSIYPVFQNLLQECNFGLDTDRYLWLHRDVAAAGVDAEAHFFPGGFLEGRAFHLRNFTQEMTELCSLFWKKPLFTIDGACSPGT